jgi:hypothetical protein
MASDQGFRGHFGRRRVRNCVHTIAPFRRDLVECVEPRGSGHTTHDAQVHVYSPWRGAQHLDTFNGPVTTVRARAESFIR